MRRGLPNDRMGWSPAVGVDKVLGMSNGFQAETIKTEIPARLDRLPFSRFHWMVIVGLWTAWILDGLEVNVVGSISSRISEPGAGTGLTPADVSDGRPRWILGGLAELIFGVKAERESLTKPLTVEDSSGTPLSPAPAG
jgi:hypothetical protein